MTWSFRLVFSRRLLLFLCSRWKETGQVHYRSYIPALSADVVSPTQLPSRRGCLAVVDPYAELRTLRTLAAH